MGKKVTVIGAGNVGAEVARQLLQKDLADLVLFDIVEGLPQGKALDLLQAGPIVGYNSRILGTNDYADIKNSNLVVITAGLARKPGMSRDDLLFKNAEIIKGITLKIKEHAPQALILMVTNPLDAMTSLAARVSGFPKNRVLGMAPLLDEARMAAFISLELKVKVTEVKACVLGTHGDLMVPVISQTRVSGRPLTELLPPEKIKAIVERTRNGGAEIVSLLKTGSAYYAPAAAAAYMAEVMLKDKKEIISSCVYVDGPYGLKDVYIGVPARLGTAGVEEIIELKLSTEELAALSRSAEAVRENIEKLKSAGF
jgi:malate dehydrogenase